MRVANMRPLFRWRFALRAALAEHLAPPVIGVPRLRHPHYAFYCALFCHTARNSCLSRSPITGSPDLAALCAPYSTPHGLNYDSKGLIPFDPRKSTLNPSLIPLNWLQIASNLMFLFFDRSVVALGFGFF